GGNRGGEIRTAINMLITMLLGGLWHGASWNFLIWGGLHGVLLGMHRFVSGNRGEDPVRFDLSNVVRIVLMFHAATLLWIFFRAPDFGTAMTMLGRLFSTSWQGEWPVLQLAIVAFCYAAHVLERLVVDRSDRIVEATRRSWSMAAAEGVAFGAVLALTVLCNGTGAAFIYFQF
ncbi:MAG TPA: hypothetical protein VEL28_16630, partial [Candidatus Binatia bacterium]|nr:hypothetical protein [Candidatus Binatia bacterium]